MTIEGLHQLFLTTQGVSTDTRNIKKNSIFFALKGERFNGNSFANKAIEQGAAFAIIDEQEYQVSDKLILVPDVLKTLQELAAYHRNYLKIPIIALTGSNGKTTTKELINVVLSSKYKTTATQGNLNNHIGVPLTLLSMTQNTEIGIVEMGANHQKEIEFLCSIAQPDFGYITNIGKAHLEGFGGIEGVLKGKTELYRHLKKSDKMIFLNKDDKLLHKEAKGNNSYTFSTKENANINIKHIETNPMVKVSFENLNVESNLIGAYNFTNIAAAIAIGKYFEVDPLAIKKAIANYIPENNRSQIIKKNKLTILLDAYNANPSSMKVAIENFDKMDTASKTVFVGDMFELGDYATMEHQNIVDLITASKIDFIYIIGNHFFKTSFDSNRVKAYASFADLQEDWESVRISNNLLIKGSRGMQLERILELL